MSSSSSLPEIVRLAADRAQEVDDPVLARLDEAALAKEEMFRVMGATRDVAPPPAPPDEGYDVEVVKPRALDVRKLARLAGKAVPPDIDAALGANVPVLLWHGMTPFYKAGRSGHEPWGMGYEMRLQTVEGDTVKLAPSTEFLKLGELKQTVDIGLAIGAELGLPDDLALAVSAVPGLSLQGARVRASTDQRFVLNLRLEMSLLAVQAGPVGAGGARWNLYRQQDRLDRFQPLLQTLMVPKGTKTLDMEVRTWVRRRGFFFGVFGSREWIQKPVRFDVSLEGLEP